MKVRPKYIKYWLLPLAWLYGLGVWIRNWMFDHGMLKTRRFGIPVICVGNITVGGTGKTPHTEYLIRLLKDSYQIAVLSRGYKRRTKGYVLASMQTPMSDIGDEPYQMKHKFPSIQMAVCEDRCEGITQLMDKSLVPQVDVVILDDAFQHRYVKPGLSVLLVDYHRLICRDELLPAGRLREHWKNMRRADMIIITKCPNNLTKDEMVEIREELAVPSRQRIYFSYLKYGDLYPLVNDSKEKISLADLQKQKRSAMLLTGIASSDRLVSDLSRYGSFEQLTFGDHHNFSALDLKKMEQMYDGLSGRDKIIITTEKDAARLLGCNLTSRVADAIYVLPVEVAFFEENDSDFGEDVMKYITEEFNSSRKSVEIVN